jgi:hypothetical protein
MHHAGNVEQWTCRASIVLHSAGSTVGPRASAAAGAGEAASPPWKKPRGERFGCKASPGCNGLHRPTLQATHPPDRLQRTPGQLAGAEPVAAEAVAEAEAEEEREAPTQAAEASNGGGSQRRQPNNVIDFSRYRQRYVALEVAYIGGTYQGLARQDGPSGTTNTVEARAGRACGWRTVWMLVCLGAATLAYAARAATDVPPALQGRFSCPATRAPPRGHPPACHRAAADTPAVKSRG